MAITDARENLFFRDPDYGAGPSPFCRFVPLTEIGHIPESQGKFLASYPLIHSVRKFLN